ncbi:hypothetical protein H7J71_24415 [Mycolicibacterium peregrinum]|uniref:hypothetical protein n=1 Tax=Mycolicibacterium peregrinum TaxID=43304 RepID=UPI0006D79BBE|nr:hypothetical protein [Mycolicibacterium peregrinum]MCV7205156.1 hypothetical protein [Mycolicibacterium peregrinum]ORW54918.1 hypothetical protein AWC21_24710 [Mycolicibacterium peregrinum]
MGRGGVIETFRNFRRFTKILIWFSLLFGVALFVVCLVADLAGAEWMKTYAYIPNILAGLTGFLIGVPFALVVLATLASQRDDKAAADRIEAVSQIAWNQFRDAITVLCSAERIEALRLGAGRVQRVHDETWHGFNVDIARQSAEEFQQTVAFAQQQSSDWSEAFQSVMTDVGTISDLTLEWLAAVRDWNTLDQYVRLQRLERGLPWFHRELDTLLQQWMIADRHPMRQFFDLHDQEGLHGNRYGNAQDMFTAFNRVRTLAEMGYSQDTFVRVWQYTDQFPVTRVEGYIATAEQIAEQMGKLSALVEQIDRNGWPAHAPEIPPLSA